MADIADEDLKPAPEFNGEQQQEIVAAIVKAYNITTLSMVLRFKWGVVLADQVNTQQGFLAVVADLVDWTEKRGETIELLSVAFANQPRNPRLRTVAAKYGLTAPSVTAKYDPAAPLQKPASLEAMVNTHSRLINFDRFMAQMAGVGARICCVETPVKKGTGFLIGADRVLTNFHVVEEAIANVALAEKILCHFDFHAAAQDGAPVGASSYGLAVQWLLGSSTYSASDLSGTGDPKPAELDYALLQLAEKVGKMKTRSGDEARGWFAVTPDAPVITLRDFVVIPQHAEGRPLEIAWGNVVEFPASGRRVRYDVTTQNGSSGSPCFTADLNLFGLHHAAEPSLRPTYNQSVPLWLIARDLQAKNVSISGGDA